MVRLEEQTILVTGATRGIGEKIAKSLAKEGATVGINHLPEEEDRANEVVESIQDQGGVAVPFSANISDEPAVEVMGNQIEAKFGKLDTLVNNAGVLTTSPLETMETETWDEVLDVNLRGTFLTTRRLIPLLRKDDGGQIINLASQLGFKGKANMVHYCASKGGVIAFTRALARELAPEIRVNGIAPGPIDTGISEITEADRKQVQENIPLQRMGEVEDVAPTAVFLAGEGSEYYTGQILSPDGGDAMH